MKAAFLVLCALVSLPLALCAQQIRPVDSGSLQTPHGIGGYDEIAYAFAKGDTVVLAFKANKLLQRVMVELYPAVVLQRVKMTRRGTTTFTVPEDGIVVIRFVNDRSGPNTVRYSLTRTAGPGGPAGYDTRVRWVQPTGKGPARPKRASE